MNPKIVTDRNLAAFISSHKLHFIIIGFSKQILKFIQTPLCPNISKSSKLLVNINQILFSNHDFCSTIIINLKFSINKLSSPIMS